jgi:hypothetical protein
MYKLFSPKSGVLCLIVILYTSQCLNADIIIDGYSDISTSVDRRTGASVGRNGDLSASLGSVNPGWTGFMTSTFTWRSQANFVDVDMFQETFNQRIPNTGDGWGPSNIWGVGFSIWAPLGSEVKLEYFGGTVNISNAAYHPQGGPGLDPWVFTDLVRENRPSRVFEGKTYYLLNNMGWGQLGETRILNHVARHGVDPRFPYHYTGTFNWRVTNLSAVPEPTSLMLVGIVGLTALGARRRFGFLRSTTSDSCSTPIEQAAK